MHSCCADLQVIFFCLASICLLNVTSNLSLITGLCKGVLRPVLRHWATEGRSPGVGDDLDACCLLCLLRESNGKCLCAPLSRGQQVFFFFGALSAPSSLLSPLDERFFEDPITRKHTSTCRGKPPLTKGLRAENEKKNLNLKFSADENGVQFPRPKN